MLFQHVTGISSLVLVLQRKRKMSDTKHSDDANHMITDDVRFKASEVKWVMITKTNRKIAS